jgi:hypothetical protein
MKTPKKRVEALEERSSTDAGPVEIVVCWDDAEFFPEDENVIIVEWPDDESNSKTS